MEEQNRFQHQMTLSHLLDPTLDHLKPWLPSLWNALAFELRRCLQMIVLTRLLQLLLLQ